VSVKKDWRAIATKDWQKLHITVTVDAWCWKEAEHLVRQALESMKDAHGIRRLKKFEAEEVPDEQADVPTTA
jgi:hypothetical protein